MLTSSKVIHGEVVVQVGGAMMTVTVTMLVMSMVVLFGDCGRRLFDADGDIRQRWFPLRDVRLRQPECARALRA